MKKIFLCCLFLIENITPSNNEITSTSQNDIDMELLQQALEIVASMSDNIANLAIQQKTKTGSPEMTKQEAVALVQKITDLVIIVIKKTKNKKNNRTLMLYSPEDLAAMIDEIVNQILEKIQ